MAGRTIIFYDEAASAYIFHYFTTAGFHTTGEITVTEDGYAASETVNGHPSVAAVESTLTVYGDKTVISVRYRGHNGEWTDEPKRTYAPVAGPVPFSPTQAGPAE